MHVRSRSRSDGHDPRPELPSSPAVLQQASKQRSNRSWIEEPVQPLRGDPANSQVYNGTSTKTAVCVSSSTTLFIECCPSSHDYIPVQRGCIDRASCSLETLNHQRGVRDRELRTAESQASTCESDHTASHLRLSFVGQDVTGIIGRRFPWRVQVPFRG